MSEDDELSDPDVDRSWELPGVRVRQARTHAVAQVAKARTRSVGTDEVPFTEEFYCLRMVSFTNSSGFQTNGARTMHVNLCCPYGESRTTNTYTYSSPRLIFYHLFSIFSEKIKYNFNSRHNKLFVWKQLIPKTGARLYAKHCHLLHKLHGEAAPWRSSWSIAAETGAECPLTPNN